MTLCYRHVCVITTAADVTPPVIRVPTVAAKEATGPYTTMTWPASDVSANDAVSGDVPVLCDTASGSGFPVGSTTVKCTATDLAGNVAYKSFDVPVGELQSHREGPEWEGGAGTVVAQAWP